MKNFVKNLTNEIVSLGVSKGDVVYVASDITLLMYIARKKLGVKSDEAKKEFLNCFVDGLQEMVGSEGTLMIPMYSWAFCRGVAFDMRTSPSEVGIFGTWILENRPDFIRTKHPLYSFMVWGKDAKLLADMDNRDAWGEDSPFGYMHRVGAKNVLLNTTIERSYTFSHYVENCLRVPYRYMKDFHGTVIDMDGNSREAVYTMYVRDLDIESKQIEPEERLVACGAAKEGQFEGLELSVIDVAKSFEPIKRNFLEDNAGEWYEFPDYIIDWEGGQTHPDESTMKM